MDDTSLEVQTNDWGNSDPEADTKLHGRLASGGAPGADFACRAPTPAIALLSTSAVSQKTVAQLVVRNLPDDLVKALKQRAARNNRSAEEEHREILRAALRGPRRRSLADVLASMPNVGKDEDFARDQVDSRG